MYSKYIDVCVCVYRGYVLSYFRFLIHVVTIELWLWVWGQARPLTIHCCLNYPFTSPCQRQQHDGEILKNRVFLLLQCPAVVWGEISCDSPSNPLKYFQHLQIFLNHFRRTWNIFRFNILPVNVYLLQKAAYFQLQCPLIWIIVG